MEWIATDTNESIVATIQTTNSIISSVCGLSIYGFILHRLLKKNSTLSQYQGLIVSQSTIGAISIVFRSLANQTITMRGEVKRFFHFMPLPSAIQKIILFLVSICRSFEEFFIIVFNIHRVLVFIRPHWIRKFYITFSPLALGYSIICAVAATTGPPLEVVGPFMEILFVPSIIVVSVVCYILIRKHFRRVGGYTVKVKKMQAKLSTSIYLQSVVHCVMVLSIALALPLILLLRTITNHNELIVSLFSVFYGLILVLMTQWYSTVIGALTLWSIRGFLKKQSKETLEVKTQISRIVPYMPRRISTLSQHRTSLQTV